MDIVLVIGRVLFAAVFIGGGMSHFDRDMIDFAKTKGVSAPLVLAAGAMAIAGGVMVALGLWADLGALLLIAFLLPVAFVMHDFWRLDDPQEQQNQMSQFLKNISLAGAAVIVFYLYNQAQDVDASVTDALFDRI